MAGLSLVKTDISGGVYRGELTLTTADQSAPTLQLNLLDKRVGGVQLTADKGSAVKWAVQSKIPADQIREGVQTYLIVDTKNSEVLDSFTVIAGDPLSDDVRAEINLLRAELDMLKRAFRRHCVETGN